MPGLVAKRTGVVSRVLKTVHGSIQETQNEMQMKI